MRVKWCWTCMLALVMATSAALAADGGQAGAAEAGPEASGSGPAVSGGARTVWAGAVSRKAPITQTGIWLQMQTNGSAASKQPQQATPAERELANQRLLDSYKYPIPEFFAQDAGGEISR